MSHHGRIPELPGDFLGDDATEKFKQAMNEMELGATGKFPDGKIHTTDEGEIKFAVANDKKRVHINFGKTPVAWLTLTPSEAADLGDLLRKHADEAGA